MRSIRFPARYYQSSGLINQLGTYIKSFGNKGYILIDASVANPLKPVIKQALSNAQAEAAIDIHQGQCSRREVQRCKTIFEDKQADVIVAIGGGKAIDTAKLVAEQSGSALIVMPSIASSDAPCSALSVVYGEDDKVECDVFLKRSPELILVDTDIILNAPPRFLAAGIGDALATFYEAESCRQSKANNCLKTAGAFLAYDIAKSCRDTILAYGKQAMQDVKNKQNSEAFERIVEANILSSCIGFESGGVATAHAIHHGLCELEDVHNALHGEKVAIGVLVSLLMTNQTAEYQKIRDFCLSVDLPTQLSDIGIMNITEAKLKAVAQRACREGEIIHNEPFKVSENMVLEALQRLAIS